MALEADTVERHVLLLEARNEVEHRGRLRARAFDVVVVDVEFGVRVRGPGRVQRNLDVTLAERVEENVGTPGAVVVEGL